MEILHNGQAIMGSPFFVEIYDPNKIRIEGSRTGMVNERMEFDSELFFILVLTDVAYLYWLKSRCDSVVVSSPKLLLEVSGSILSSASRICSGLTRSSITLGPAN